MMQNLRTGPRTEALKFSMRRKAPKVGDVVKSRVPNDGVAGFIVATEGIHVWVRFFDTCHDSAWDVYSRRDTLEVVSRANSH